MCFLKIYVRDVILCLAIFNILPSLLRGSSEVYWIGYALTYVAGPCLVVRVEYQAESFRHCFGGLGILIKNCELSEESYLKLLVYVVRSLDCYTTLRPEESSTVVISYGAAQNHWNNGIRHSHSKYGYQAQDYWNNKPERIHGTVPSVPTTGVRQVYHTHQRGSARIPYGGSARVLNRGQKKMYRGTLTTTILDGQRHLQNYHPHSHKYKYRDQDWELSRDEPVRSSDACAKCPPDRAVIAKRGSTSTLMEKLPIIPCFPWSNIADVRHEIVMGPQPGQPIGEGSHALVTRLYHFERPVATCHARYNVIVRKCEPLELQGGVTANCPLGEAWGGVCHFACPEGYELIGANSTECDSQLEWSNDVPQCTVTTSCTLPVTPENGHITCRTPHHRPIRSNNILPDATVCHYWCSAGFKIPASQHHLTTVTCMAGAWNSTQDPTCVETNSLQESSKELSVEKHHRLSSPRLGRKHCPKSKCHNGGRCYVILGEQVCMCRQGFTGPSCSEPMTDNSVK